MSSSGSKHNCLLICSEEESLSLQNFCMACHSGARSLERGFYRN